MAIGAIPPIGGAGAIGGAGSPRVANPANVDGVDFGEQLKKGLQSVSDAERSADAVAENLASGGPAQIHDLMVATSKASISVDLLVQVRNRAVEAYQEIMRMQV